MFRYLRCAGFRYTFPKSSFTCLPSIYPNFNTIALILGTATRRHRLLKGATERRTVVLSDLDLRRDVRQRGIGACAPIHL